MRFLTFGLLVILYIPAFARDVFDEVAEKTVLEEQPKTVEEAINAALGAVVRTT